MVRNVLCWDANNGEGLPKQKNPYQSSPTFLSFESPIALFVFQHNLLLTMWPDRAKGLFIASVQMMKRKPLLTYLRVIYLSLFPLLSLK